MASVVDTSVKNFNSTMAGAPTLSGTAGSWIALFDAVGVNGFDLKTPTSLSVAGGVATLSFTGSHSAQVDSVIAVSGSSIAALNGEQKVTAVGAGFVKFATAAADGVASGSISFKMAPLGFSKLFAGPNLAAYRSSDMTSTNCVLRVDDTSAQFARVVGYESMSDINTGVGAFPSASQMAGGGYWAKSVNSNATAVSWFLIGDGRIFYFGVSPGYSSSTANLIGSIRCFGDIVPERPGGDAYGCVLNYGVTSSPTASMSDGEIGSAQITQFQTAMPREYTGLGSAVLNSVLYLGQTSNNYSGVTGGMGSFPSKASGGLWLLAKAVCGSGDSTPRGILPGCYHVPQSGVFTSFKQGDVAPGADMLAGRNLVAAYNSAAVAMSIAATAANCGISFFDRTGPWR